MREADSYRQTETDADRQADRQTETDRRTTSREAKGERGR